MKLIICAFLASIPAFGGIGLVSHTGGLSTTGANGATTLSINTTGATFLTVAVTVYSQSAAGVTLTDSNGNTWHALANQLAGTSTLTNTNIWYSYAHSAAALVVGSSHTVTISCSSCYPGMTFSAWSGTTSGVDPYDGTQSGGGIVGTSYTVPSITPTQANELVITSFGDLGGSTYALNSPFAMINTNNYNPSIAMGNASAYVIQTTAVSAGPTWTLGSGSDPIATSIAAFRPAVVNSPISMAVIW